MPYKKRVFRSDLHLLCSKNSFRNMFGCVHFDGEYSYATNGHVLVRQKTEGIMNPHLMNGKSLTSDAYRMLRFLNDAEAGPLNIRAKTLDGGTISFPYKASDDTGVIVQTFNGLMSDNIEPQSFAVDSELLYLLHRATISKSWIVQGVTKQRAIILKPTDITIDEVAIVSTKIINA